MTRVMGIGLMLLALAATAEADEQPGQGVAVKPLVGPMPDELFQTLLVSRALEELGYTVEPPAPMSYADAHAAIGRGEGSFLAVHWDPLNDDLFAAAGGDRVLFRSGLYVPEALQGYLIDARTAREHRIERIDQLKEPALRRLFDTDGDGKANLVGCAPGWSCEAIIDHHLEAYGLRDHITHDKGDYDERIAAVVRRKRSGKPVLYYGWTPHWASALLRPGADVVWLEVPFSALPGKRTGVDTTLVTGHNFGFALNNQRIISRKDWVAANPSAGRLFEVMTLPIEDISAQNLRMHRGERSPADIARHVDAWIVENQALFDSWLQKARASAKRPERR